MRIKDSIREHLDKRLKRSPVLVVYDPERRYFDIVQSLAVENCRLIDGSLSTILGREQAILEWCLLAEDENIGNRLIIYLPINKPVTDREKQANPYQIFSLGGGEFPEGDSESYQALCRQAAPEQAEQIDHLFEAGTPDLEVIENLISKGTNWPTLKAVLQADSSTEILVSVMAPSEEQERLLKDNDTWLSELSEFLKEILGQKLKTRSKQISNIGEEIWRYILFSEFCFDRHGELPEQLKDIPRASGTCRQLVYAVCDVLRGSEKYQNRYVDMANKIAREYQLEKIIAEDTDLGDRDTFSFEERTYLRLFSEAALKNELDVANRISGSRKGSIWVRHTAERQQQWTIADRALQLMVAADDIGEKLAEIKETINSLFDFYIREFFRLDRLHRSFEQSVADAYSELEIIEQLIGTARSKYRKVADSLQSKFTSAVNEEGWPLSGRIRNTEVFDKFVAPWVDAGKKTAYIMVDALRYELAVELENELSARLATEVTAVCAQLPTVTAVGMAALLPEADGNLKLIKMNEKVVPSIGGHIVISPKDRLEYLKSVYGDRCQMSDLADVVSKPRMKIPETVQLLVLKTTDIDKIGEMALFDALSLLPQIIQKVISGVKQLQKRGFSKAVIATDHGFVIFDEILVGDVVPKPPGEWVEVGVRSMLGSGSPSPGVLVFGKSEVGIDGEFDNYAVPKSFGAFSRESHISMKAYPSKNAFCLLYLSI